MAVDILQTLIVRLKADGAKDTQAAVDKTKKSTERAGVKMNQVSKKFGLAFKAAGLFAVGLFASILKGGPVTAMFLAQIWRAIGHLGDTILQKAGAWDILSKIVDGIYSLNDAIIEADWRHFVDILKLMATDFGKLFKKLSPLNLAMGVLEKAVPPLKTAFSGLKTALVTTVTEMARLIRAGMNRLWRFLIDKVDRMKELWNSALRLVGKGVSRKELVSARETLAGFGGGQDSGLYGPAFAEGGIVTKPTRALIGEAGPEAVIPLSQMGSMGGDTVIHMNIQLDGRTVWQGIKRHAGSDLKRLGGGR